MSPSTYSFLNTKDVSIQEIERIFERARLFKEQFQKKKQFDHLIQAEGVGQKTLAMAFFEPSTRTRVSFQMAAFRLGIRATSVDDVSFLSIKKGESYSDTVKNLAAMYPDLLVVRYGTLDELDKCLATLNCPVINAGSGTSEHPTQALLDAFTIQEFRGQIQNERVLIVGDVLHSRVANSNLILLKSLGAEVAYCAPEEFIPEKESWQGVQHFSELTEGMKWATVVMGLRIQKERHGAQGIGLETAEYRERYRIGTDQMDHFIKDGVLLHPGPVIRGVEVSSQAMEDPRCHIRDQVTNGVFVRAALLSTMLGFEVEGA